ncbi:AsmA-like C-terminal region-containing protein [Bizionia sediminis]|uniref:AsmA-like C-terminal region-containing protein n=1 Tax=Bizionia sediminis TaxID=1737064 RepID=A0ABW5KSN3_9FLAO
MKKALKIIGSTLLVVLVLLVAIPFVFQGKIKDLVQNTINNQVNAQVTFTDISLSFLKSFPNAQVDVSNLEITNLAPFAGEKLASVKSMSLAMSIKELFKDPNDGPMIVDAFSINEALIVLKTNQIGQTNYDIAKTTEPTSTSNQTSDSGFTLDVKNYQINNSALTYIDESGNIIFYITELNHSGTGTFSDVVSELDTKTTAKMSLSMDGTEYLSNHSLKLDAIIGLDLPNNTYSFKENKALINGLPLTFNGYVTLLETGQELDISFENPGSDFKEFLAVIPETYSKDLSGVQTTGDFKLTGRLHGIISEETIPKMAINMSSKQASFKYPDLPKRVENITINASVNNTTGFMDDTFIDINTLDFQIDDDRFNASATLKNLTSNMLVTANLNGILNLAHVSQAYPMALKTPLQGILKANIQTNFDMNAIETNAYQRIKSNGNLELTNFLFHSETLTSPLKINQTAISFKTGLVALNTFEATLGESDISANGTLTNLLGFLLSDKNLQGDFNLNAKRFNINDFMVAENTSATSNAKNTETDSQAHLKIPAFLDCTINAFAETVIYDNLSLKNTQGNLQINNQTATLSNLRTNIFNGTLAVSGSVNTQDAIPHFNLDLNADAFNITESINTLELLKALAPIANIFEGTLNTNIQLNGDLDSSFSPILSSVSGKADAEIRTSKTKINNSPLLNTLDSQLQFIDLDALTLNDLKTNLSFQNGQVTIKPFYIQYKDIDIAVGGSHGFDKTINYNIAFNVPASYLGSDINRLIGKINDPEVNSISIPVTANVTGSFANPKIETDLSESISNLTKQLIEIEKQKLINQGTSTLGGILDDIIDNNSNNSATPDSTNTAPPKAEEAIKNILGSFLKKKKTQTDSVN